MENLNHIWIVRYWKSISLISFLLLLTPILLYVFHFSSFEVSNNPGHWGVFGDYLGGVLNPIISLISLIILGLLTWLVARQSNEENYNLSIKRLRVDVLEEFSANMIRIVEYETKLYRVASFFAKLKGEKIKGPDFGKILRRQFEDLERQTQLVAEARIFFNHVYITKNHLFKYDFNNSDFKVFNQSVIDYDNMCLEIMNKAKLIVSTHSYNNKSLQKDTAEFFKNKGDNFNLFSTYYKKIINDLKKEVNH